GEPRRRLNSARNFFMARRALCIKCAQAVRRRREGSGLIGGLFSRPFSRQNFPGRAGKKTFPGANIFLAFWARFFHSRITKNLRAARAFSAAALAAPMAALEDNLRKIPPQNLEAESSVLGGILLDNEAINHVLEVLRPEDFYRESHRKIFRAMIQLSDRNEPVDIITLADILKNNGELEAVGGAAYLTSLNDFVPTAANIAHYARIVREKAILRSLISTATEIATRGYEEQGNVEEFLDSAEKIIFDISEKKIKAS